MGGYLSEDTVTVAGLAVKSVTFGEVTSATGFDGVTFDGLFGLAYKSISADGVEPVFATMVSQGLVGQNLFGVYLSNETTKITHEQWYVIDIGKVTANGKTIANHIFHASGIVDTGTSLLIVPPDTYTAMGISVNQDCSGISSLPTIGITIGSTEFQMTPAQYVIKITQGGSTQCLSGITGASVGTEFTYILGDTFLRTVYTVFNIGASTIGFAPLL